MTLSTHRVEVVRIGEVRAHPNADRLECVNVWGYPCVVGKGEFKEGDLGLYIPPDSVVTFALAKRLGLENKDKKDAVRVRAKRLRGAISMGVLAKTSDLHDLAPSAFWLEGEDLAPALDITHYEPKPQGSDLRSRSSEEVSAPVYTTKYNIDSLRRYAHVFEHGEPVVITEKIHGEQGRWTMVDGVLYAGTRNHWWRDDNKVRCWRAIRQYAYIVNYLGMHPGNIVYGEVYGGGVQSLNYNLKRDEIRIAIFDIWDARLGYWLSWPQLYSTCFANDLPMVPYYGQHGFEEQVLYAMAEGRSMVIGTDGTQVREGIVVKPVEERSHPEIGRVILKVTGAGYLEGDK